MRQVKQPTPSGLALGGCLGIIFMAILKVATIVGVFYGFIWVLNHFGILELIKEAIK